MKQKTEQTGLNLEGVLGIFHKYSIPAIREFSNNLFWSILAEKTILDLIDDQIYQSLKEELQGYGWDMTRTLYKIYIYPKHINKWEALSYTNVSYCGGDKVVASGSSVFDLQMLQCADYSIIPKKSKLAYLYPFMNQTQSEGMASVMDILNYVKGIQN